MLYIYQVSVVFIIFYTVCKLVTYSMSLQHQHAFFWFHHISMKSSSETVKLKQLIDSESVFL